jgi:hypothetical protein
LVNEVEEDKKVTGSDGKQEQVTRTVLRVVNRGHEVTCVRVKAATIVPALFPALALNDITDATRVPAPLLVGSFGISDFYAIEDPDRCLQEITGVLIDTPRTSSRWMLLANYRSNILSFIRSAQQFNRPLDEMAAKLDRSSQLRTAVVQRTRLEPLMRLLPYNYQITTYVEVSYRDILGKDHVSYFKLPGDGLPMDQKAGNRCFRLYDQQLQEDRFQSAEISPTLAGLRTMSPDPGVRSGVSC